MRGEDREPVTMLDEQEKVHGRSAERRRSRVRTPVFVDGSGRRHTWLLRSLVGLAILCAGYVLVLAVGLLGGSTPGELLPWSGGPGTRVDSGVRQPAPPAARPDSSPPAAAPTVPARPPTSRLPIPSAARSTTGPGAASRSSAPPPSPSGTNPTPTASASPTPTATHGRSAEAPGHVKHSPPPRGRPAPTASPTPVTLIP